MPSLVNGFSFLSLETSNQSIFDDTLYFYQLLGFQTVRKESNKQWLHIQPLEKSNRSRHSAASSMAPSVVGSAIPSRSHSPDRSASLPFHVSHTPTPGAIVHNLAISTSTPAKADDKKPGITILLQKTENGTSAKEVRAKKVSLLSIAKTNDWRSLKTSFVLYTPDLPRLSQVLDNYLLYSRSSFIQTQPNDIAPAEIYILDPLGNVLGFTSRTNPFSSVVPKFQKLEDAKHKHSQSGVATPTRRSFTDITQLIAPPVPMGLHGDGKRKIAVMTSGGDSPGMNAAVRAIVRTTIIKGCEPFAIYEGYEGLVTGGPECIRRMAWDDVRSWLSDGGTNIGTARSMRFKTHEGRLKAAENMIKAGIDALIVVGGDGSLTGADVFRSEWRDLLNELVTQQRITRNQLMAHRQLTICGLVGSIDNDMASTDSTIGAYSSLDRICKAIDYIDATANSHSRAFVVEVMGRHCGWLTLMAGIATSADYIFIPEKPAHGRSWEDEMCDIVKKHRSRGKRKTIVLVAEGAISENLDPITPDQVKDVLVSRLGLDTRVTTLGHVQRGGTAVAFDRILATMQGVEAVNAVLESSPEIPSPMISINENKINRKPLVDSVAATKLIAKKIDNKEFKKAMDLRTPEFAEHLNNYYKMNSADHDGVHLPEGKRLKIALINVGAPAGGMNAAVYAAATYCFYQGHKVYAINNGFSGLTKHESIKELEWLSISDWASLGGSELGTNRHTPGDTDLGLVSYYFKKYEFDGLILVGGFEAFESLNQLERARVAHPAFRIPMVCIPATISNNVPGTEYSIGSDTCLNSLVDYCDVIKLSSAASRKRVFVVEVQGGNCGYIASMAAMTTGAQAVYTPEHGVTLKQLELDIEAIREQFLTAAGRGREGKLFIRADKCSKVLTTEVIADIIREEANGRFSARTAIPGHVQQGGIPSPIDRTRATRLAIRAIQFIEQQQENILKLAVRYSAAPTPINYPVDDLSVTPDHEHWLDELSSTAAVLGVKDDRIVLTPVRKVYDYETEVTLRRPKKLHWKGYAEIAASLVDRVLEEETYE